MGKIEDNELRELFKTESYEHIQGLEKGLLHLENNPSDAAALEDVFREAHSLKGASRMVGARDIELISHNIENILGSVRKGASSITSVMIDRVCQVLDSMKRLVNEAATGEPSGVNVAEAIELLKIPPQPPLLQRGEEPQPPLLQRGLCISRNKYNFLDFKEWIPDKSLGNDGKNIRISSFPRVSGGNPVVMQSSPFQRGEEPQPPLLHVGGAKPDVARTGEAEPVPVHGEEYRIDTVRVDTSRLDELLALTGELSVFKTRLRNRFKGVDEAVELLNEITRRSAKAVATSLGAAAVSSGLAPPFSERLKALSHILLEFKEAAYEDTSRFEFISAGLEEGIKQLRLLPFSTLFNLFTRAVRDMAREAGKEVELRIEGGETGADKRIIEDMKDPLMHILRNAVVHGIEEPATRESLGKSKVGLITLRAYRTEANIIIEISDDGRGLDIEAIKAAALKQKIRNEQALAVMNEAQARELIFASGFSTSAFVTEASGRGVGLDVVRTNVGRLKGTIEVESISGAGCSFRVKLPATLATAKMLLIEDNGRRYAIPMDSVQTTTRLKRGGIFTIEGREAMNHEGSCISVAKLSRILELANDTAAAGEAFKKKDVLFCVIIFSGADRLGVLVDELLDEQEVVLRRNTAVLKRVRNVVGAAILGSGEVCIILNPSDMMKSVHKIYAAAPPEPKAQAEERKKLILLVEDSITTRTQERRILEGGGYEVVTAVDGLDALSKISTRRFDAVVSDIMMPNMDGLTLTGKLRQDKRYKDLPVVLITTLASDEDKKKGLEAGANAYIPKPAFDQKIFLDTLRRLV